jgi:threonylcarbamoyladenosine tRNA methylthiotransferase MtaB
MLNELIPHTIPFEDVTETNVVKNSDNFLIQIQDGCNHRCTYCVIWKAAGKNVSKPISEVMREFNRGLQQGYKHFYFLGECSGAYGLDFGSSLGELLRQFHTIDGDYDILIEDVAPLYFLNSFEDLKILCTQGKVRSFHTPIQSGSNRILNLMRRKCDMEKVKARLLELREACPKIILSSAVIVGFPTETTEELQETIDYCNDATFDSVACHMYSPRPGSVAAEMDGQITEEEKVNRYNIFKSKFNGIVRVDPNQRKSVE